MVSKENTFSQIEASGNFPALPEFLLKLLTACEDSDSSLSEIAHIIKKEPSLSLRVLQLTNSAYFSFRSTFKDIEQATVYLGTKTIKNLAITTSVHHVFAKKQNRRNGTSFSSKEFWYHSLMCATLARRFAFETANTDGEEAYLAGLLHDIGKLLLLSTFPKIYAPPSLQTTTSQQETKKEIEELGVSHGEVGAWFVQNWNLSSLIADAIRYHNEDIDQVREAFPLVRIVSAANILSRNTNELVLEEVAEKLLGIKKKTLIDLIDSAGDEVENVAQGMGIIIDPPTIEEGDKKGKTKVPAAEDTVHLDEISKDEAVIYLDIASRVKNFSFLYSFLEEMAHAGDHDSILIAFERAVRVLLFIDRVLFFFPDKDGVLLHGRASSINSMHNICRGITLALNQDSSRIVKTFIQGGLPTYMHVDHQGQSLADQQILSALGCTTSLLLSMNTDETDIGVIVAGLPRGRESLSDEEINLLKIIARQISLGFHFIDEKQRKEEALKKERMDAIALAARKFAHEINNPLGIISNYLTNLKFKLTEDHETLDDLAVIEDEIRRISLMISQMQMFSQTPFQETSLLDINILTHEIIRFMKSSLFEPAGINISFIPGQGIPFITTSKDAIKQVLINLLKNGAEAMTDGGRMIIRTKKYKQNDLSQDDGIEIIISDSGPGLPDEVKKNLFKPFVSTKQQGHSGLGLSISEKIITEIGGKIECVKTSPEGTTFSIYLPITTLPKAEADKE